MTDPLAALLSARVFDLSQPFDVRMSARPGHSPFRMGSIFRHGDQSAPDDVTAALELITMSTHTGTHIDALAHIAHDGTLHGDVAVSDAMRGGSFVELGAETISPLLYRGVVLDVAAALGVDAVEPTHGVTAEDLTRACERQGVAVEPGDAVLIRVGWGSAERYGTEEYLGVTGNLPGVETSGARWLVEHGAALTGTDTIAYEVLAPGDPNRPVHRILLRDAGVYIIENLALDELAASGSGPFALLIAPLRLVGASGAPVRPLAVVPR